jgi:hypothetical protein
MLKYGKPRIAFCFSGQPRTWKKCVESWKEHLFKENQVDIFCHIWDYNTSIGHHDIPPVNVNVPATEINELLETLNPKKYTIESQKEFVPIREDQLITVSPWLSQYYGIMQCARLKRQYEIENDLQYDIVIKMRFDAFFNTSIYPEFNQIKIDEYTMHGFHFGWDPITYAGRIGDIFWYANSETYDIISDFYINIPAIESKFYRNNDGTMNFVQPETVFFRYLKKNDINLNINHYWDIKLFRESQASSKSEVLNNSYEIW